MSTLRNPYRKNRLLFFGFCLVWVVGLITGCEQTAVPSTSEQTSPATPVVGVVVEVEATETAVSPTATAIAEPSATELPGPTETAVVATPPPPATSQPLQPGQIVVNRHSIDLFPLIPDDYIRAAVALRMLYIDLSVGQNINEALDCLSRPSDQSAPNHCVRHEHPADPTFSVDPTVIQWARPGGYDRSNWHFRPYQGTDCGYWYGKVGCYLEMVTPIMDRYDVVSHQLTYGEVAPGSSIVDQPGGFFYDNPDRFDVYDEEAFAAQHPDKIFIYWTTSLARSIGTAESDAFNEQMRQYALENGKILFDVADILSHDPDGNPCYDNRDGLPYDNGNNAENYPDDGHNYLAICPHYTTEVDGGHLGSVSAGKIRVAKAFWVLMAQIAGWDGQSQ
jgi:hypothetical protein